MTMLLSSEDDSRKERRFTRLFACPASDAMFQSSITLHESLGDPIDKVFVGHAVDGSAEC